ncbi:hypothetical protein GmHk_04G010654 [Glycine max]|nr:hypothetical protein GmHk_04G010654 [Glycine max]
MFDWNDEEFNFGVRVFDPDFFSVILLVLLLVLRRGLVDCLAELGMNSDVSLEFRIKLWEDGRLTLGVFNRSGLVGFGSEKSHCSNPSVHVITPVSDQTRHRFRRVWVERVSSQVKSVDGVLGLNQLICY